jgi:hypothetical protein
VTAVPCGTAGRINGPVSSMSIRVFPNGLGIRCKDSARGYLVLVVRMFSSCHQDMRAAQEGLCSKGVCCVIDVYV